MMIIPIYGPMEFDIVCEKYVFNQKQADIILGHF